MFQFFGGIDTGGKSTHCKPPANKRFHGHWHGRAIGLVELTTPRLPDTMPRPRAVRVQGCDSWFPEGLGNPAEKNLELRA
jgi:hypothetical protein